MYITPQLRLHKCFYRSIAPRTPTHQQQRSAFDSSFARRSPNYNPLLPDREFDWKALFQKCRLWFDQEGLESFVVRALTDNVRAKHFYEKEGGNSIGEITITLGDKNHPEAFYLFKT